MQAIHIDNYADIGNYLRRAREVLQLDIEAVSRAIHIRAKYLRALEDGSLDDMPAGGAYIKGYMLQYAKFLGLREEDVLECVKRVDMLHKRRPLFRPVLNQKDSQPDRFILWGSLGVLLFITVLYGLMRGEVGWQSRVDVVQPLPARFELILHPESRWSGSSKMFAASADCFYTDNRYYPACYQRAQYRVPSFIPALPGPLYAN